MCHLGLLRVGFYVIKTQTILITINLVVVEMSFIYHKVLIVKILFTKIVVVNLVVTKKAFNCYPMIIPFCKAIKRFLSTKFWWYKFVISNFVTIEKGFDCHPMSWLDCWMVIKTHFKSPYIRSLNFLVTIRLVIKTFFCC